MMRKIGYFLSGGFVFLGFVFFSFLVHKDIFNGLDFDTTVKLQDKIPRKFDDLFSLLSVTGAVEISSLILIVILALRKKISAFFVLFFYGAFHFLELYGKIFVDHLPPPEFMVRTKKLAEFPQFYVRAEYSYPSGHAARAAFLSIIIGFILLKTKKLSVNHKIIIFALLFAYDSLMFASRLYLGEHWLSDIIGGGLLGVSLGIISGIFI